AGDIGTQLRDGTALEEPSDDGRALERRALLGLEQVDTGGDQRLDRGRDSLERAASLCEGDELLDEERVAAGGLDDVGPHVRLDVRCEQLRLLVGERTQP